MTYLLLILYFALACWLIPKMKFVQNSGLTPVSIRTLFVLKVLAGFALGWISLHYYGHKPSDNDYWKMNGEGWQEYQLLLHNPKEYFTNLFNSPYANGYSGFFNSMQSYWNDLRNNLVIKMVSVFDIFSQRNYHINSIFINTIGFFGHVALFRLFSKLYQNRRIQLIIGCFLLPSMLYFSSGLHKDAIVFTSLAIFLYAFRAVVDEKHWTGKRACFIILSLLALLLIRSYIFMLLIPAVVAYYLCKKNKWRPVS